jgi:hypothetical protein
MVSFAERLFETTDGKIRPSAAYFTRLWPQALKLLG